MSSQEPLFLTSEEVAHLTGRKFKSKQVETLRQMAIPFRVNASGRPIVTRAAVEGRRPEKDSVPASKWQPSMMSR